jgi:hypothetical protein
MPLRENTINEERFSPVSRVQLKEMDEHSLIDPLNKGEQGLRNSTRLIRRSPVPKKVEGKP